MKSFAAWFTTQRRQGIQLLFTSLVPLFMLFGLGTDETWAQWGIILAALLQMLGSLLSLLNLEEGNWGAKWAVVRGAIYSFGLAVAPAFTILGWLTEDMSGLILSAVSITLTVLSSLVAVLTSGEQQLEHIRTSEYQRN